MDDLIKPEKPLEPSHIKHLLLLAGVLCIVLSVLVITRRVEVGPRAVAIAPPPSTETAAETECPRPTTKADNGDCVLTEDVTIGRTLALDSSTTLDCQGHTLSAKTLGSGSTADTYQASVPELAILLNGTIGTTVKNCTLEGFDFGVVVIKSKIPEALYNDADALALRRNRIISNTITARAAGVAVFGADNNEISLNTINFTSGGGKGVHLHRDSDRNMVTANTISGSTRPGEYSHFLPGSDFEGGVGGSAVVTSSPPSFPLLNLVIDHKLVAQFPNVLGHMNSDNVIAGNVISLPGPSTGKAHKGIVIAGGSENTIVRNNVITGGLVGIVGAGYAANFPGVYPTTCSLDPARFCTTKDDCFIPGVDTESKGTCKGTRNVSVDYRVPNTLVESNTLNGPFNGSAMEFEDQPNLIVQDNSINGTGNEIGIQLSAEASQGGAVRRNVISGARIGLVLTSYLSHPYGAKVSLNDIRGSTFRAIEVGNAADNGTGLGAPGAAELSVGECAEDSSISCSSNKTCQDKGKGLCVNMRGNYWGRTCADSEGFRESNEKAADSPKMSIVDSHPYGVPVAMLSDGPLPATCK